MWNNLTVKEFEVNEGKKNMITYILKFEEEVELLKFNLIITNYLYLTLIILLEYWFWLQLCSCVFLFDLKHDTQWKWSIFETCCPILEEIKQWLLISKCKNEQNNYLSNYKEIWRKLTSRIQKNLTCVHHINYTKIIHEIETLLKKHPAISDGAAAKK